MAKKTESIVPKEKAATKKAVKAKTLLVETKEPKESKVRPARETVPVSVMTLVNLLFSVKGPKYLTRVQRYFINKIPKETFKRLVEERLGKESGKKALDLSKVPLSALLAELGSRKPKNKVKTPKTK